MGGEKAAMIERLQRDILRLQGFKSLSRSDSPVCLHSISDSFPGSSFPLGAVHEFLSPHTEAYAATVGFISTLLHQIMATSGVAVWISTTRTLYAPGLKAFGVTPDRVIFIDLNKESDVLWAVEEALKYEALSAVVGETNNLSFTASRRLQLAVENSRVTGFMIRRNCRNLTTTACVSRWRITHHPSVPIDDLPGIGWPGWKVELLRIKNGRPGNWIASWAKNRLNVYPTESGANLEEALVKTG